MNLSHEIKETLGALAPIIACMGDMIYIRDILQRKTQPHVFSWIIWILIPAIVFCGQIAAGAGPGAWLMGYNATINIVIAYLAWSRGDRKATTNDRILLAIALAGIPLWAVTKDPLWSICLETIVAALAFFITIRKSWYKPFSEGIFAWIMFTIPVVIELFAMDVYSPTALIYPIYWIVGNIGFIIMLLWCRRIMRQAES